MRVVSVNISERKGTVKRAVPELGIDESGIAGDAHAGAWHRQVSILSREIVAEFENETGRRIAPGEFAENITVEGIDLRSVCLMDRFIAGELELEVTQIGKACHGADCAIFREVGKCVMPKEGIFCRVLSGGTLKAGDSISQKPVPLLIRVLTMSDRASAGKYKDRSGPRILELLGLFLRERRWRAEFETGILPDDAERLRKALEQARDSGVHAVFTTGGTGVGPRDVTPDVVTALADKTIPGIMDHIRLKFGKDKPNALLSRSVAAVMGETLVYALPGGIKAVEEYVPEILSTLEHLLFTVKGLDTH